MLARYFLILLTFSPFVFGARVAKLGKTGKLALMAVGPNEGLKVGDEVCGSKNGKSVCGRVVVAKPNSVIVRFEAGAPAIAVGDIYTFHASSNKVGTSSAGGKSISIGGLGGISKVVAKGPTSTTAELGTGYVAAGVADFDFSEFIALEVELGYTRAGAASTLSNTTSPSTHDMSYMHLIAGIKVKPLGRSTFSPYLILGPYAEYLAASRAVVEEDTDLSQVYSDLVFGIKAGLGADLEVSPRFVLFLTGRYDLGLANVFKAAATTDNAKLKGIEAVLGFRFRI